MLSGWLIENNCGAPASSHDHAKECVQRFVKKTYKRKNALLNACLVSVAYVKQVEKMWSRNGMWLCYDKILEYSRYYAYFAYNKSNQKCNYNIHIHIITNRLRLQIKLMRCQWSQ